MSVHPLRRVSLVAGLLAVVAASALAGPVSADAGVTRYVDDDGLAAMAGCDGSKTVASSIQAAIDASAPSDTVIVCPGAYHEAIDVDVPDLTLRGATKWSARLDPASSTTGAVIQISSDGVRVQWLKVLGRTTGDCSLFLAGIRVAGVDRAAIIANRVIASPKGDAWGGPCGIEAAIHVVEDGGALIRYNLVRDWRMQGIFIESADPGTAVKDNSVRYWRPDPCAAASTISCSASAAPAGADTPTGIQVHATSAVVTDNVISSRPDVPAVPLQRVDVGIRVSGSNGMLVRGNTIARAWSIGIAALNVTGSRLVGNTVTDGVSGIQLIAISTGNTVRGNQLHGFVTYGILAAPDAGGNTFRDNTVSDAAQADCRDLATGNTWTGNVGADSDPVGICSPI